MARRDEGASGIAQRTRALKDVWIDSAGAFVDREGDAAGATGQWASLRFVFSGTPDPDPNGGFPVSAARLATAAANDEALAAIFAANTTRAIEVEFTDHYVFSDGHIVRSRAKLIGHGDASWVTFVPTASNDTWVTWSRNSADASQLTEEDQLPHCGYENLHVRSDRSIRANAFWFYGCDFPVADGVVFGFKGYARRYSNSRCGTLKRTFSYYNGYTDTADGTNNVADLWIDSAVDAWDGSNMLDFVDCQIYYPFGPCLLLDGAYSNDISGFKFHALARADTEFEANFINVFTQYNGATAALGFDGSSNPKNEYAAMHVGSASAATVSGKLWQDSVAHYNTPVILKTDTFSQTSDRNSLGNGRIIGGGGIYGAILATGAGSLDIGHLKAESAAPWAASVTIDATTNIATVSSINAASCCNGVPPTGTPCMITAASSPGGLPQTRKYFVIRVSATTLKFATTYTNAIAETAIDITSTGTTVVVFAGGMLIAALGGATITLDEKTYLDNGRTAMFYSGTSAIRGMPRLGATWSLGPLARQISGEQVLFDGRDISLAATGDLALTKRFGGWIATVSRVVAYSRGTTSPASAVLEMWTSTGGTGTQIAYSTTLTNANTNNAAHVLGLTGGFVYGSATYDPASLADGAGATTTVTATGAALGDLVEVSFSLDLQGITLTGYVSAANTVSVRFQNESGGVLDLGSGTVRVRVTPAAGVSSPTAALLTMYARCTTAVADGVVDIMVYGYPAD